MNPPVETRTEFAVRVYWEDGEVEDFPRNAIEYAQAFARHVNAGTTLTPPDYRVRRKGRAVVLRREVVLPPWEEVE